MTVTAGVPGLVAVTWWGHSTLTLEDAGVRVLTDPVFTDQLAHLYRRGGGKVPRTAYDAQLVLVSHAHADHLHVGSLKRVHAGAVVLVPHGLAGLVRRGARTLDVWEVSEGEVIQLGPLTVTVVPAEHRGARGPWSRLTAAAVGYVVRGSAATYFAGDTGPFDGMRDIGRHDLDLALLPVGGWSPTALRGGHLDAVRAADALRLLRPRVAVPIHYGTFWPLGLHGFREHLFRGPGPAFAAAARAAAPGVRVDVLHPHARLTIHR